MLIKSFFMRFMYHGGGVKKHPLLDSGLFRTVVHCLYYFCQLQIPICKVANCVTKPGSVGHLIGIDQESLMHHPTSAGKGGKNQDTRFSCPLERGD